jgi:sugar-phosphatase
MIVEAKGLLFDMDGVLVSSIGSVNRCWKRWAQHYGVENADTYQIPHGTRAVDIIRTLKPDLDVAVGLKLIEDMEIEDVADLEVLAGAKELLESLPVPQWAIVTSATKRLAIARLGVAGLPVPERFITGDMVEKGKPDPEPYRRGAELLGVAASECVVVEDAPSGVGAGVAAGCRVLGVLGTHTAEELRGAGVSWVVASLKDVRVSAVDGTLRVELQAV